MLIGELDSAFMALDFTWDPRKASSNQRKHGGIACSLSLTPSVAAIRGLSTLGSLPVENGTCMKKVTKTVRTKKARPTIEDDEMRPEYDFSGGVRGKYAAAYAAGTNLILLEPDLAVEFPDSRAVSRALRAYLKSRSKRRTASHEAPFVKSPGKE